MANIIVGPQDWHESESGIEKKVETIAFKVLFKREYIRANSFYREIKDMTNEQLLKYEKENNLNPEKGTGYLSMAFNRTRAMKYAALKKKRMIDFEKRNDAVLQELSALENLDNPSNRIDNELEDYYSVQNMRIL